MIEINNSNYILSNDIFKNDAIMFEHIGNIREKLMKFKSRTKASKITTKAVYNNTEYSVCCM